MKTYPSNGAGVWANIAPSGGALSLCVVGVPALAIPWVGYGPMVVLTVWAVLILLAHAILAPEPSDLAEEAGMDTVPWTHLAWAALPGAYPLLYALQAALAH